MAQGNRRDEKMRSDRGEWDRKRMGSGNTDKRKKNRRSRPSGRERRAVKKYRLIRIGVLLLFLLTVVLLLRSCIRKVRGTDSMSSDYGTVNVDASEPVIDVQLLDVNPYSRPGTTIDEIHGIVIHYTANPGSTAQENRDYFNGLKDSHETEASSNFVVGLEGEIIQCVPTWEMAYASNERNADTVSIECCHPDDTGKFTKETYQSMVQLTAWLCKKYNLNEDQVIRHYDVTGKICPNPYVYNEGKSTWDTFKKAISAKNADHETKKQVPEVWYRVRKTWKNAGSQVGAFKTLKQAKQCADQYAGYRVYNTSGKKVYVSLKLPYKVQVKTGTIPVRSGPAKTYRRVKQISKGVFEITEEKMDLES